MLVYARSNLQWTQSTADGGSRLSDVAMRHGLLRDPYSCGAQCSSSSFSRYPLSNAARSQYSGTGLHDLSVQLRARAGNQPADGTSYLVPRGSRAGRLQYLVTASHGCGAQLKLCSFIVWGWIYAGTYLRICESYSGPRETCFTA